MGNCDRCGKKFGWREHPINLRGHVQFVINQNIMLTKFDNILPSMDGKLMGDNEHGWHKNPDYCSECTHLFFMAYARQYSIIQKIGTTDKGYRKWANGMGADVFKNGEIIENKIEEVREELKGKRLETYYDTGDSSLFEQEQQFLEYEALGMKYDARHAYIMRDLERNPIFGFPNEISATVGATRLYKKYQDSCKKNYSKEIEEKLKIVKESEDYPDKIPDELATRLIKQRHAAAAVEGKREGRSPI